MQSFKRLTASLLAASLLVSVAACGKGGDEPDAKNSESGDTQQEKTIRVSWWGNQVRNDGTVAVLDLYSKENPGVKFDTEFTDWTGYWDKLATQSAAKSLPDIMQQDYKYIGQYQSKGQLADLTSFVESGVLNLADASESIVEAGKIDEKLYAVCLGINAPAMIYDLEAAKEAGVDIKNGMTVSEVEEAAKKIFEKTGKKFDWSYYDGENLYEYYARGKGVVLFQKDKLGIEDPSFMVPFFQRYIDDINSGTHFTGQEASEDVGVGIEQDPLPTGRAWMALAYSNQLVAFADAANKKLGAVTWPVGDDDTELSMYLKPSQFFSVSETSANKEEAAKVIDFFTNSIDANKILLGERGVPISSKVSEALLPDLDETDKQIFEYIDAVEEYARTINPPAPDGMGEMLNLCNSLVEQVCFGKMTAEQAAEEFFTEGNRILSKNKA
jgi:multiple sugar transport system substrate-binding protein